MERMFAQRFGDLKFCPNCAAETSFYKIASRKCYSCKHCGHHIYPLAGTIFHKSATPLKLWFFAIFLFTASKNGVSAMELQRQLGVTYKTAWRMAKQIRQLFADMGSDDFDGTIEADETYIGGHKKHAQGGVDKAIVFGMVQRGGKVRAEHVKSAGARVLLPRLRDTVAVGTTVYSDQAAVYRTLTRMGYIHESVNHSANEWARGKTHTNTIEGFWSQMKRSIDGTYHAISPKYLQTYVNEFAWRYNQRKETTPAFLALLGQI